MNDQNQEAAVAASSTEPLRRLLRWAEMLIEANQATGHFKPHGFVRDHACRECFPSGTDTMGHVVAGFSCGYHNALAIVSGLLIEEPSGM